MTPTAKKGIMGGVIALVLLIILSGFFLWFTRPERALNAFLKKVEAHNKDAANTYISESVKAEKKENAQWFIDDWMIAKQLSTKVEKDEAWRARENGTDKKGNAKKEVQPVPRYWAHNYQAFVTVAYDEYEDDVIIKLRRKTENGWSRLAQLFRGWEIVEIKYQPIDEEDFEELDFSEDEFENFEDEEGLVEDEADLVDDEEGDTEDIDGEGEEDNTNNSENTNENENTNEGLEEPSNSNEAAE